MESIESLISVIVPVYNGESYLADCIESIEGQTYRNLEIIIINDGSTDGTGRICDTLRDIYKNITVITMEDEGVSAARNAGIEEAKGALITFVDADDRLRPEMLTVLHACMKKTESDIAGCRFFIWGDEAEWQESSGEDDTSAISPRIFVMEEYVRDALLQGNSRCWSKLYKRELIGSTRFRQELSIGEDMLFLLDLLPGTGKIAELEYQGYGYYQNPNGTINRKFTPKYMDQITCWEIAGEKIRAMEEAIEVNENEASKDSLHVQVTTVLIMGIMLTVGKIAVLSSKERRQYREYIAVCHGKLKEAMRVKGILRKLSIGYRVKTLLFRCLPNFYILLYHNHKSRGK